MNYLNKKDILIPGQYGFRKKRSTYLALIDICEQITNSIDNHDYTVQEYLLIYQKHLTQLMILYSSQNYNIMEYVVLH